MIFLIQKPKIIDFFTVNVAKQVLRKVSMLKYSTCHKKNQIQLKKKHPLKLIFF